MSQYDSQEDLDRVVGQLKGFTNEKLIAYICSTYLLSREANGAMNSQRQRNASEDYELAKTELMNRLSTWRPRTGRQA